MSENNIPNLPLKVARDIEQGKTWENITSPADLARYLATILTVDPNSIVKLQEVVANSIEPVGEDRGKIWIKTESPQAIGIFVGGVYSLIYQYPPNVAMLWMGGTLPQYMERLTDSDLTDLNLTAPENTSYYWVIFRQ